MGKNVNFPSRRFLNFLKFVMLSTLPGQKESGRPQEAKGRIMQGE